MASRIHVDVGYKTNRIRLSTCQEENIMLVLLSIGAEGLLSLAER
jgi:hypothetical protein